MTTDHTRRPAAGPRPRRAGALLAALVLGVLSVGATQAGDGAPDAYGYWFTSPVGAADPSVPEDGLVVAGIPSGPVAVAALRFTLDDPDEMAASIHLTIDQDTSEVFLEEPLIYACPAEEDWEPAEGGSADEAPGEACSPGSAAQASLGEDGDEYVFVVSQFIEDGELDVLITPGVRGAVPSPLLLQLLNDELVEMIGTGAPWPGPETVDGLDGSNFRVTFEAPREGTLRTGEDSADDSVTSLSFDGESEFDSGFDAPDDAGGSEADGDGGGSVGEPPNTAGSSGGGAGAPASDGADMGDAPAPETADPPEAADGEQIQDVPPGEGDGDEPVALGDSGGMGEAEPAGALGADPRMLGALVLGLGALGAGVLAMGPEGLAAAGARAGAGSEVGGLAQFARPRRGPPPRL